MKEIPIVFSSNEAFIPYMSAMLQSIMEHSNNPCIFINYNIKIMLSVELSLKASFISAWRWLI